MTYNILRKKWIQNTLLCFASILFALILCEIILRVVWVPWELRNLPCFGHHPFYDFAPLPAIEGTIEQPEFTFHYRHTRQGLRGEREFSRVKPADVKRVLLLGDSYTYGVGSDNDKIFAGILQKELSSMEIANTGCNGYGTRNVLAVLDRFGAAFQPDLSIYVFFWNDLSDNLKRKVPGYRLTEEGKVERVDATLPAGDPLALQEAPQRADPTFNRFYTEYLVLNAFRAFRYQYLGMRLPYAHTEEEIQTAWGITEDYLHMLQVRAQEIGTKLAVAALPDHNQVNESAVIRNIKPRLFEVQEELRSLCAKHDIPYYDLLPEMKARWQQEQVDYYYYADRHLTPIGNQVVADLVLPYIQDQLKTIETVQIRETTK